MCKRYHSVRTTIRLALACAALAVMLAGCGGRSDSGDAAVATERVAPTALSAQFAMPTSMITPGADETVAAETATPGAEAAVTPDLPTPTPTVELGRGERVYINQDCGKCHGEHGEGVPDEGSALAGTALTDAEFEDALRTGKRGELGTDHIYGQNRISPGGVEALYEWLRSLPVE